MLPDKSLAHLKAIVGEGPKLLNTRLINALIAHSVQMHTTSVTAALCTTTTRRVNKNNCIVKGALRHEFVENNT